MHSNLFNKADKSKYFEISIGILASILAFRKPATIGIILFLAVSLFYLKDMSLTKWKVLAIAIIAAPLLLDVIFFFNNDQLSQGLKHMEKRSTLFLFPLVLISFKQTLNLIKILKIYVTGFSILLFVLLIRFCLISPDLMFKYLAGIHLWEMGYSIALSTASHAPALNMHIAFLLVATTYILLKQFKHQEKLTRLWYLTVFCFSFFMLLLINTRLALVNGISGVLFILFIELFKKIPRSKLIKIISSTAVVLLLSFFAFAKAFPYTLNKYTKVTFAHMDKVGKLDDFESPEHEVYSSLVTRVSIWKTASEVALDNLWIGVGAADGKDTLNQAYKTTNQKFLYKYKFPVHNQFIDFFIKFGLLGIFTVFIYMFNILFLGLKLENSLVIFFFILFFTSNLTDDFLIRFDGITFSALWIAVFSNLYWNRDRHNNPPIFSDSFHNQSV